MVLGQINRLSLFTEYAPCIAGVRTIDMFLSDQNNIRGRPGLMRVGYTLQRLNHVLLQLSLALGGDDHAVDLEEDIYQGFFVIFILEVFVLPQFDDKVFFTELGYFGPPVAIENSE